MFELFMYVYSLSARFFAIDRALNSYFMIMIIICLRNMQVCASVVHSLLFICCCYVQGCVPM